MAKRDYKHVDASWRHLETNEHDRQLDAALAKYTAVEPRAGLEERVLATLRTVPAPVFAWWRWGVVAAISVVVAVAVALAWRSGKPAYPELATNPSATTHSSQPSGAGDVTHNNGNAIRPLGLRTPHRKTRRDPPPAVSATAEPKLDQFPSPQPLSEQEKILMSYVSEDLKHAVLIARAQAEALRQDQEEEEKWESNPGGSTDLQQRTR